MITNKSTTEIPCSPFIGCKIAVTGRLEHFTRKAINARIEELGAKPRRKVSRNTDYLICGTKAGSKLWKAYALGIKVLSEQEFINMTQHW
jgi:DNA ligase (NAD+)